MGACHYPIWWGIAAWPVDNFVKANDFTGKTVIPFCTAASSGIGDSGNLLQEMAGTGDWKDGEVCKIDEMLENMPMSQVFGGSKIRK